MFLAVTDCQFGKVVLEARCFGVPILWFGRVKLGTGCFKKQILGTAMLILILARYARPWGKGVLLMAVFELGQIPAGPGALYSTYCFTFLFPFVACQV